jgi:hypothetical protein
MPTYNRKTFNRNPHADAAMDAFTKNTRRATYYCGCCGRECPGDWCSDCRPHLKPYPKSGGYMPQWERTYIAQHGVDCPYAETHPEGA